jgi:hypothetical protein
MSLKTVFHFSICYLEATIEGYIRSCVDYGNIVHDAVFRNLDAVKSPMRKSIISGKNCVYVRVLSMFVLCYGIFSTVDGRPPCTYQTNESTTLTSLV